MEGPEAKGDTRNIGTPLSPVLVSTSGVEFGLVYLQVWLSKAVEDTLRVWERKH